MATLDYIPPGDRAYLVAMLSAGKEVVGHLCLIGTETSCFSKEHEHLVDLMRAPISLAMVNMNQHRKTKELQQRLDEQRLQLAGEVSLLKDSVIIGRQGGLHDTMILVEQLVGKETPTLIMGETGTGKELIADAIQRVSPRKNGPYIKVNCGAIPESLMDSELFGYEKGAFTGATKTKAGKFEQAEGGTLFLDEVGELSPQAQVRLLRVLQNGIIERVGGSRSVPVDVRIIAATNRPLETMLEDSSFREDLYYRLNVFPITIPPLRNRPEDIPLLAHKFIQQFSKKMKLSGEVHLEKNSLGQLQDYPWPGNVRQFRNLVERALTLDPHGPLDLVQYLPKTREVIKFSEEIPPNFKEMIQNEIKEVLANSGVETNNLPTEISSGDEAETLLPIDSVLSAHITRVLKHCGGKISGPKGAAEILEINPSTLRKRMKKLGIPFGPVR